MLFSFLAHTWAAELIFIVPCPLSGRIEAGDGERRQEGKRGQESEECGETGAGKKGGKGAGQGGEQTGKAEWRMLETREENQRSRARTTGGRRGRIYRRQETVSRARRGKGDR